MKRYALNNIVVPFDFSISSVEALQAALEIADSSDKIRVIHAVANLTSTENMIVQSELSKDKIADNVKKLFAQTCDDNELPELEFEVRFGDPGTCIADFSKQNNAGLIVISSHGRTGLDRILLGSVAERVVRLAYCPVLVLRADEE